MKKENTFQHLVSKEDAGQRLDRYLCRLYPALVKSLLQKALRQGNIRVDSLKKKPDYRLCQGQTVSVFKGLIPKEGPRREVQNAASLSRLAEKLKTCVLYEDTDMVVINKPAGVACQGGTNVRASLDRALEIVVGDKVFLVHRLDKETTGVLLVARTRAVAEVLSQLFFTRQMQKTYVALVKGEVSKERGVLVSWLKKEPKGAREAMQVFASDSPGALYAETTFTCLEVQGALSFLRLHPLTGRKHQLRAQLAFVGTPILGDGLYDVPRNSGSLCLHAQRLVFLYRGKAYSFEAPLPANFCQQLSAQGFSLPSPKDGCKQDEDC